MESLHLQMSTAEMAKTKMQVNNINKALPNKKSGLKNGLGKDSFLKLLVTQLKHQNPTKPMDDKQFIAQMAQFSSLEQISNLNKEFKTLIKSSQSSEAFSLIGKTVDAFDPVTRKSISGTVDSIQFTGGQMSLKVDASEIAITDINRVYNSGNSKK